MIASTTSTMMRIPTTDSSKVMFRPSSTSRDAVPARARLEPWRTLFRARTIASRERHSRGDRVPDETSASEQEQVDVSWLDDHVHLDLTENGQAAGNGEVRDGPSSRVTSARANDLASDHWRERAVIWRERAQAAELVAKMLQRNLDDLHATIEDLRREAKAVATAHELEAATHSSGSGMPPWRRFVRDVYDQYLR